ncbi:unknown [Prevotella sp. CAG:1124]|nr:unknown [Prevotella sp. CAG:1124]
MFRIFPTIWHNGNTGRLNLHSASGTEWRFGLPVMIADNGIVQSLGARAGLITPRRRACRRHGLRKMAGYIIYKPRDLFCTYRKT